MPSFSCSSVIRATSENYALSLRVTHNLVHGSSSKDVLKTHARLPKEIDILWLSDIVIVVTGSINDKQVGASEILHSGLLSHLQKQLRANGSELGLDNVSRPYIDEEEEGGRTKMTLTPSRALPHSTRPHVLLTSLHLLFAWKTVNSFEDTAAFLHSIEGSATSSGPFSSTMYLPTETLLGRITEQFLIHHLVGRYPLIFGPWRMGLDREMKYFLPISRSVIDILGRSQNPLIRSRHTRLMKLARHRLDLIFRSSSEAIASHLAEDALEAAAGDYNHHPPAASLSDEDVLCQILEQMYRDGIPQRRPRLTTAYRAFLAHEGDDYDLVNPQDADLFDTNTSASLSLLDEEFADVPFTAVHPSHIYDQDTSSNKVDGHDRKAERLPRDNKTTPSMHAELDHEGMCPAHSPALDTDFSTPSSELLATWVPSTWQDKINPISTPPHHDPLCNAYDECLLASCMDLDPVTRHHPVASHGHKCALPGNNPFEASYLWMWSHHGAHDQPQNPEHLTLDDNSSWASSGDIEILSSPFVDATPVSTVEDIDLSLLDAVDIDDFVADSVETNLAGDSLLQDSLDSDVWFPDETYDPTHAEDPAIHFLADLWDM